MKVPTVHLNGTSQEELLEQWRNVYRATYTLLDALAKATPHGRDYYVQGPDGEGITQARKEHAARIKAVHDLQAECADMANAIGKQGRQS
jgi:hypothetical protein